MGKGNRGASTNVLYIISDSLFGVISFIIAAIGTGVFFKGDEVKYFIVALIFMLVYLLSNKEARIYNITTFFLYRQSSEKDYKVNTDCYIRYSNVIILCWE